MKKCPYCGSVNDKQATVCKRCKAAIAAEEPKEQPKKAVKKTEKE
jgi:uncharacterized membrane protein YvbJ